MKKVDLLLNEKIYTNKEMGVTSDKIEQVDLGHRFSFKDVFDYITTTKLKGYIIFGNADIFVDETIKVLIKTNVSTNNNTLIKHGYACIPNIKTSKMLNDMQQLQKKKAFLLKNSVKEAYK